MLVCRRVMLPSIDFTVAHTVKPQQERVIAYFIFPRSKKKIYIYMYIFTVNN